MKFLTLLCLVAVASAEYTMITMYYDNAACDAAADIFAQQWYQIPADQPACVPVDCFALSTTQSMVVACSDTQPTMTIVSPDSSMNLYDDTCAGTIYGVIAGKSGIVPVPSTSVVLCDPFSECCDATYNEFYWYCLAENTVEVSCMDVDCLSCYDATEYDACTEVDFGAYSYYYIDACVDDSVDNGYMRVTMYDTTDCTAGSELQQYVASVPPTWMCVTDSCTAGRKIECAATAFSTTVTGGDKMTLYSDDACTVNIGKMAAAAVSTSIDVCDPRKDCCDMGAGVYVKAKCSGADIIAQVCTDANCATCTEVTTPACTAMSIDTEDLLDVIYYNPCTGSMLTAAVAMLSLFFALF